MLAKLFNSLLKNFYPRLEFGCSVDNLLLEDDFRVIQPLKGFVSHQLLRFKVARYLT
ncbi:hypothetical protein D3C86_2255800 [compost metagenome]